MQGKLFPFLLAHGDAKISCRYFTAVTFMEVTVATRRSMRGAVFDEMIRPLYSGRLRAAGSKRIQVLPYVRDVRYSIHEELVPLLDSMQHSTPLRPIEDGPPLGIETNESNDHQEPKVGDEMDGERGLPPAGKILLGVYTGHSEQDEDAAWTIQLFWKRFLDRKRDWMKGGQEAKARCWFELYRKGLRPGMHSKGSRFMPQYSVYFLGPLPNLQAALDSFMAALYKSKESLRRRLGNNPEELEADGFNLNRIT